MGRHKVIAGNGYMPELFRFFDELALNNNRQWLAENRRRYDELREAWLTDLSRLMTFVKEWDRTCMPDDPRRATYRFARDTRFSPDKTPYKTYFSAAFGPRGRQEPYAGYYIHIGHEGSGGRSGLYGGVYCPPSPVLSKLRHAIVDNIEEFTEIISAPDLAQMYPGWYGDALKTIPKGWERNHPQAELLRLKDYGKFMPVDRDWWLDPAWPERTAEALRPLKPLVDFLNYSIDE